MQGSKVFIVEDDPHLQFFYKQIITLNGFELVGIAGNGGEAISMFKSFIEKPDVIIMDHRMPVKNGIDTSKELLEIDKNLKIVFSSADASVREEALSLGVSDFIDKPFTIEKILDLIQKVFISKES